MDILTLRVHHPKGADPIFNHSIPMVVRRDNKNKSHGQRRITLQWVMKGDDPDIVMVCMTRARRDRHFARITAQSSNPIEGEELDNAFKGHETPIMDEATPMINKNKWGMASFVLRVIDDEVSLTT